MLKKRNLIFLSLLILSILLLSSCFLKPPETEGLLKGQVLVPEGTLKNKDLTGQALPDATVNIIDLSTGAIIATTTTDADGNYQVFVPAGGPYLLEAASNGIKVQQITPQVEVGIDYDLGTADATTTAVALIVQAMLDEGANLSDINLADIESDPGFDEVLSGVTSVMEDGGDPTTSSAVNQAVEEFLNPPEPSPTPPPTYTVTYDGNGNTGGAVPTDANAYESGEAVTVSGNTGSLERTQDGISLLFTGWNTASDGSGTSYQPGNTFAMGSSNVTLYAQWTAMRATGPAGGLIFYDQGSVSDGWRYLEAALVDQSIGKWGTLNFAVPGADGTDIGTGKQNTLDIITGDILGDKAADKCASYSVAVGAITYNDWFLPSKDEIYLMYTNLHVEGVGNFSGTATDYQYYSSSEYDPYKTWFQSFYNGNQQDGSKFAYDFRSRPARAFRSIAPTYLVNYHANGATSGSIPSDPYHYEPGEPATVLDNTGSLAKTGYTFTGWNTKADGTGTDQAESSTFNMGNDNVTLYAKWTTSVHNITQDTYYTAIQLALDDANSDDVIEVADGTYAETIRFNSTKIIILQSVNGPSSTTIIGVNNFGTVICTTDSPDGTTLEGFTITHDTSDNGRGITNNGFLTVHNCIISNNQNSSNTSTTWGGGIGNSGTLTITGSTIDHNSADNGGGGINNEGTLTITGSTISHNTVNLSAYSGGGIYNKDGTITITGNTINNNSADRGGAIEIYGGTTTIGGGDVSDYNFICGNTTDGTCTVTNQIYPNTYPNNYICVDCACGFAALRNLKVSLNDAGIGSILEQSFDCDTISYTAIVTNDITNIYITPQANCSVETITVNDIPIASGSISGPISLSEGENLITIIVTAKDGTTTKTYIITVTRGIL